MRECLLKSKISENRVNRRLARLINTGTCPADNSLEYSAELKQIADEVAKVEIVDKQSRFFKALADATRLRILKLLEVKELCVCEVMIALGLTQPTASHHLGILENAGLLKGRKQGKWVYYSIAEPRLIKSMHKLGIL